MQICMPSLSLSLYALKHIREYSYIIILILMISTNNSGNFYFISSTSLVMSITALLFQWREPPYLLRFNDGSNFKNLGCGVNGRIEILVCGRRQMTPNLSRWLCVQRKFCPSCVQQRSAGVIVILVWSGSHLKTGTWNVMFMQPSLLMRGPWAWVFEGCCYRHQA